MMFLQHVVLNTRHEHVLNHHPGGNRRERKGARVGPSECPTSLPADAIIRVHTGAYPSVAANRTLSVSTLEILRIFGGDF